MSGFPKTAGGNLKLMGQRWNALLGKAAKREKAARKGKRRKRR